VSEENYPVVRILPSALAKTQDGEPFVAIVRSREELCRWLENPLPGLSWLQVEGILGDSDAWIDNKRVYKNGIKEKDKKEMKRKEQQKTKF